MERVVSEITERIIRLLPEGKSYYTRQDLLVSEVPSFVVERVVLELKRNLAESLKPPESEWVDMQSESVQKAWSAFLEAIRGETRLPESYLRTVLESAIGDIVDLLVEPRRNITEHLFETGAELTKREAEERVQWLVIYPYFRRAILKYIEKKGLDRLQRKQCDKVVYHVDEKLIEDYTPLHWAQLIEPWFQLMGDEVESELLRKFFEDKDLQIYARRFEQLNGRVSRSRLIEVLSQDEPGAATEDTSSADDSGQQASASSFNLASDQPAEAMNTDASPEHAEASESPEEDPASLMEQYGLSDPHKTAAEDETEEAEEIPYEEPSEHEQPAETYNISPSEEERNEEGEVDIPMWKRFVSSNDDESEEAERPIIDLSSSDADAEDYRKEYRKLMKQIEDVKEYFIEELFGRDEAAFERCIEHIVTFSTWTEAAKFITQEVFRRNLIDMYSDVAVEFTDRMQTYFLQKSQQEE